MPKAASGSLMRIILWGLSREVSSAFLVSYCAIWILRIIFLCTACPLRKRRQARGLAKGASRADSGYQQHYRWLSNMRVIVFSWLWMISGFTSS